MARIYLNIYQMSQRVAMICKYRYAMRNVTLIFKCKVI
jgi:hypothetical protein